MPIGNRFAHQTYSADRPKSPFEIMAVSSLPQFNSREYKKRMQAVGEILNNANVGAIVLIHGTFVGEDPWGLSAMLFGRHPKWYRRCCRWQKKLADRIMLDRGNFPSSYAANLSRLLAAPDPFPTSRFLWSSMNNHIGRSIAAVRLLSELNSLGLPAGKRILLCGHSHGGNVLALLTNLLSPQQRGVSQFLDAVAGYARTFDAAWDQYADFVKEGPQFASSHPLDLVTLGTPIRYGFETSGYENLLHFVNHRPSKFQPNDRFTGSLSPGEMLTARHGDYIHQLGIAGSNFTTPFVRSLWRSDRQLADQLSAGIHCSSLLRRIALGMRVPEEGATLLIDYGLPGGRWWRSGMGHAEYTHTERMLFHFEQIVRRFYLPTR